MLKLSYRKCLTLGMFLAFCTIASCLYSTEPEITPHDKDLGIIARLTTNIFSKEHYRQKFINNEISEQLFDEYFKSLDPNRFYFTSQDINNFKELRSGLDKQLLEGNISLAFDVYNLLIEKVTAYNKYVEELLAKSLDFTVDEEFNLDRSKAEWPKNESEQRELWRLKTKNDILYYRLVDKAQLEENKKTDKDKDPEKANIDASWIKRTPEEKLKRRLANNINNLKENDSIDILELYLTSLANVYDPHSAYMSPKSVEDFNINMSLSLVGIGATLTMEDGYTKVLSLVPGGPADMDGRLEPEDRIIAVSQKDSEPVDVIDMPLSKVVRLIRGTEKTEVSLTILKGSKGLNSIPESITLVRDKVKLTQQEARGDIEEMETGGAIKETTASSGSKLKIGILTLPSFYYDFTGAINGSSDFKSSTEDVQKILKDFNSKNVDGLVIDIRSNGGGSLLEAIRLTGLFITAGPIVQVRNPTGVIDVKIDPDKNVVFSAPIVVLANRLSASASEIFAGAIQDYGRGLILGDKHTHGKGTVQTIFDLSDYTRYYSLKMNSGSVRITTQKFYRINGESTQIKGVAPDIVFPSFTDTMEIGEEYLDHALPWDTIPALKYQKPDLGKYIPELKEKSSKRIAENKDFTVLTQNIDFFNKMKEKKTVSLNEEKRWRTYLDEKKIFEQQEALIRMDERPEGGNSKNKNKGKNKESQKDIYLDEAVNILCDFITAAQPAELPKAVNE